MLNLNLMNFAFAWRVLSLLLELIVAFFFFKGNVNINCYFPFLGFAFNF